MGPFRTHSLIETSFPVQHTNPIDNSTLDGNFSNLPGKAGRPRTTYTWKQNWGEKRKKREKERNSFGHNLQADKKCLWLWSCASLAGTADTEKMLTYNCSNGTGKPGTLAQLEMEMGTRGSLRASLSCLPAAQQKETRTGCRNGRILPKRPGGHNNWYSLQNRLGTSGFQVPEMKQRGAKIKLELFKIPKQEPFFS